MRGVERLRQPGRRGFWQTPSTALGLAGLGQLVHLPICAAVGEVAVIAPDLFDRRVRKKFGELVAHTGHVLDEAADGRPGLAKRLKIVLPAHGRVLERLDLGFDKLATSRARRGRGPPMWPGGRGPALRRWSYAEVVVTSALSRTRYLGRWAKNEPTSTSRPAGAAGTGPVSSATGGRRPATTAHGDKLGVPSGFGQLTVFGQEVHAGKAVGRAGAGIEHVAQVRRS